MRRFVVCALVTVAVALAAPGVALAGAQGRARGKVTDTKGNPIPNARIVITTDEIKDFRKEVSVGKDGTYSVLILDATRHYLFHVEAPGYQAYEEKVKIPAGDLNFVKDFQLKTEQEAQKEQEAKLLEQPGYKELAQARDLLEAGDKDGALAKFEAAVAARDDLLAAWVGIAELRWEKGDAAGALEAVRRCLDLDPDQVRCLATGVNAARSLGDETAYRAYLAHYQEVNPDDPATLFNQAAEYLNKMDDAHARPLLERCLKADPDFPKCLYEYGMLLLRSGDMEGAKRALQHYLEVAPEGPDAAAAREALKYL